MNGTISAGQYIDTAILIKQMKKNGLDSTLIKPYKDLMVEFIREMVPIASENAGKALEAGLYHEALKWMAAIPHVPGIRIDTGPKIVIVGTDEDDHT